MASQGNINFHQTFKPERQYIGSILNVADNAVPMSVQDISAITGIPNGKSSGKVEPHIIYTKYMGLIDVVKKDGLYKLSKSSLGKVVESEDPGLQEELSILLCHAMLLRKKNGADMWNVILMDIMPRYRSGIKKELLLKELEQMFEGKANKKNLAPFIGSYEDMFACLNILSVEPEIIRINGSNYNKEFIYLYAYVLFEYWDELFPKLYEISSIQFNEINFGNAFGWNEQKEYEVLEHLADKGVIRMNKQLVPYTIIRLMDKEFVMEKLYSELC